MKSPVFTVSLLVFLCVSLAAGQGRQTIVRPGVREADRAEMQTEKDIPPPLRQHAALDLEKLGQDADNLSGLAQTVPTDVSSLQKGMLPKDLLQKLKEIEKLSKHLRSQIGQ